MNLEKVIKALAVLNPHDGANPHGNCTSCAADAAEALIGGAAPAKAAKKGDTDISKCGKKRVASFPLGKERAARVWKWLVGEAGQGVYLFETGDHSYNVVKHKGIYVLDSNTLNYKKLTEASDGPMRIDAFDIVYNYLDPPQDEDIDPIEVWFWGPLHGNWH